MAARILPFTPRPDSSPPPINLAEYLPLAYSVARLVARRVAVPEEELLSEALLALIIAGSQFDPASRVPFPVFYRRLALDRLANKLRKGVR
jgi:hypothetical protein